MKENSDLGEGLPKTLVLFLHTITVPEATGEKMATKPETIVCGVVLVFLVLAGNRFWCYVRTWCTIQLCGCVIFFVVARKLILYKIVRISST